jgi:Family of unknown function (DUF5895)
MTTTKTESTALTIRDEFADESYNDTTARMPRIQALRGEKGDIDCGYFVTEAEMGKASWYNVPIKDLTNYTYNSGGSEQGLLIKKPRMLVSPKSPMFAFDRQQSTLTKKLVVVGQYNRQQYADRSIYGVGQYYEILLLDQNNAPLHEIPFGYIAKGANMASFSQHWQELVNDVTRIHAQVNQISARPKNQMFTSLCVFQFAVKRELAGDTLKSYACKIDRHAMPTLENWETFFLGRQPETASKFLNIMVPSEPNMLSLPMMAIKGELV